MGHLLAKSDARRIPLPDGCVQCCVTSPPYFGLRDYGTAAWVGDDPECDHDQRRRENDAKSKESGYGGQSRDSLAGRDTCRKCGARRIDRQVGLEASPSEFVAAIIAVFREVYRVLRDDGTLWLNLGDSYAGSWGNQGRKEGRGKQRPVNAPRFQPMDDRYADRGSCTGTIRQPGLKPKDLIGIPWRIAFALQADGWYLRSDVIWCLSGGTWLYAKTQKGEMPVMLKDLVRLDPDTVKLWNGEKWTQVLGWNRSTDEGEKLELVLRSGERIGCTDNHQWPTQRGNVKAGELVPGDVIKTCQLPEPQGVTRPAYLTELACWFVGLYLAEGSMSDDTIQISAHADELHWVDDLTVLAKHYGGTITHTLDGNNLAIRIYSRVLRAIMETYVGGSKAIDKHLKVAAWGLDNFSLSQIASGYLAGDGHDDWKNGRVRLGFCRNYSLERDLRTLAARLGATLTLRPVTAQFQEGSRPAFRGEWRWDRSGHWSEKDRGEIVEIRRSRARQCWDIGVEDEPHLFALASGVLTHNSKPNPMPESVTDRPTKSHEYVFLLSKNERYFYDSEAVKDASTGDGRKAGEHCAWTDGRNGHGDVHRGLGKFHREQSAPTNRNIRSVWTVPTHPFPGAHFATFPPKLIEPCVKAGTSQAGCCPRCGKAWERVVEREIDNSDYPNGPGGHKRYQTVINGGEGSSTLSTVARYHSTTIGFRPACSCPPHEPVPCLVLDPFSGANTTGVVATGLGRRYVGFDLNAEYLEMGRRRIERPHQPIRKREKAHPLFAGLEDAS